MRKKQCAVIAAAMASTSVFAAAAAAEDERRELDAHEHGHGSLTVAMEQGRVHMELEVPGADIVGFEYAPESDADIAAVDQAKSKLADPLALFKLPDAADCTVDAAEVAYVTDDHDGEHDDHADEHQEHEEHAEGDDHEGDHEDHNAHKDEARHAEFHAEYVLACGSPDALSSIEFAYFDTFTAAEELEVGVITEATQALYEVERDSPSIELPAVR